MVENIVTLAELREKYIKNPPEGITTELVRRMTNSGLLNMHHLMAKDDDFDGEFEEGFYIFKSSSIRCARLVRAFYIKEIALQKTFSKAIS